MATRQYIGARYVPKFFENSLGGTDWAANTQYEPLTIVTWNGNSYTSKKAVPAEIGNPAENASYWASTGIFNSQVEQLREEVEDVSNRTNNISTFALYIGNSYAIGTDVNQGNGIYNRTKDLFDNSYLEYAGGSGFVDYDGSHSTYLQLMQRAVNENHVNVNDITHVFFISAMGDSRAYAAGLNIRSALNACAAYARDTFPNLKEILVTLAEIRAVADLSNNALANIYTANKEFTTYCKQFGMHYIGWTGWDAMYNSAYTLADNYHPSAAGYEIICQNIRNCWRGEMEYKPFKWNGLSVWNIPENMRVSCVGYVSPFESYIQFYNASTSAIPATYDPVTSGSDVVITLPTSATAIPNFKSGERYWVTFNSNWSGNGKWLPYALEVTPYNGGYAVTGITRFALSGDKSELSATANIPINFVMHSVY